MIPLLIALALPAQAGEKAALRRRVFELEDQVAAQDRQIQQLESSLLERESQLQQILDSTRPASAIDEAAATALLEEITDLRDTDPGAARAFVDELMARYPNSSAARRAQQVATELAVVGEPWPGDWSSHVLGWLQGEGQVVPDQGTVLVVFFEEWCPYCRRELPTVDAMVARLPAVQGLAVTRVSKSSTEDKVRAMLADDSIDLPVLKEDGTLTEALGVSGVPAAAVLRDGRVVWRGHPARLTDALLSSLAD